MHTVLQRATVRIIFPLIIAPFLSHGAACADEGVLSNGERVEGELSTDGQGVLHFRRLGQQLPLPLDQLDHVCFSSSPSPPLRAGAAYRILLRGGQHLTSELLGIGSDKVEIRTAWKERISIPRAAVAAVRHAPGFVTIFRDDFENGLKSWRLAGAAVITTKQHVSGRHSLCLGSPGQAEYTLLAPLAAGRAGINFHDRALARGLAWQVEAEFPGSAGWPAVRVGLDPRADRYTAEVSGTAAAKSSLPRKDGWQRLNLEFSLDMLVLSIDDDVLCCCRQPGSGGALSKVRLSCTGFPSGTSGSGEVFFDDFSLARAVPELPHPKGDPEQDAIWLLSGDQVFGTITDATAAKVNLHGSFGPRTIGWSEVRGIYFRQSGLPTRKPDSKTVRIWLHPGSGFEPDVLEGIVERLDKHRLVLGHEVLGELEIDRKRLHRLRLLTTHDN